MDLFQVEPWMSAHKSLDNGFGFMALSKQCVCLRPFMEGQYYFRRHD